MSRSSCPGLTIPELYHDPSDSDSGRLRDDEYDQNVVRILTRSHQLRPPSLTLTVLHAFYAYNVGSLHVGLLILAELADARGKQTSFKFCADEPVARKMDTKPIAARFDEVKCWP
jgi:hypothetical protein